MMSWSASRRSRRMSRPLTQVIEYLQKVMDQEAVSHSGQDPRIS
jgi:hypothetical protein